MSSLYDDVMAWKRLSHNVKGNSSVDVRHRGPVQKFSGVGPGNMLNKHSSRR